MIPSFLRWPLACALVGATAFPAGYLAGAQNERTSAAARAAEGRVSDIEQRESIEHEIGNLEALDFDSELDRWLSPVPR